MDDPVTLTKELVRFQTAPENDDEIRRCLDYIASQFSSESFDVRRHEHDGVASLIITFGDDDPEVILHGHIDVVAADEDMYEPEERDGKLFGRGTADMKAGVACLMTVMQELEEKEPSVGLMIVSDEEQGGQNGAGYLFDRCYDPSFAISAEPNNMEGYMDIFAHQKGMLRFKLVVEEEGAHGSRPWKAENAAEVFWDKYQEVKSLFPRSTADTWTTTINLGVLEAGEAINKVPRRAVGRFDVRYTEEYPPEAIKEDLRSLDGVDIDILLEEPPLVNDEQNHYIQQLQKAAADVLGTSTITRKEPASDMRFLTEQDTPAVVFGPEGYNVHSEEEYAVIESFHDYIQTIEDFIRSL